jgi:enoyl-CoA hydratase
VSAPVRYDVSERVATITLDCPANRNALTDEMLDGLIAALIRASEEDAARCVILASSHERVWCAGGNLSGFAAERPLVHKHFSGQKFVCLVETLTAMPKPTLAAVGGHALGGGLGVALACDLVLAKDSATFGTPEIDIGAFPFMIMSLIYRNLPRKLTNELLLVGERLSAEEARAAGIVNRVVSAHEFDDAVAAWAGKLAAKSPLIMKIGKQAMRRQLDMPLEDALEYLCAQLTVVQSTQDLHEGVNAFFEKREPAWNGR